MEEAFVQLANLLGMLVEMAAVLIVAYGSIEAFIRLLGVIARPRTTHGMRKVIWRRYGMWLVLGLEFEEDKDHIGTALEWGVRVLDKPVVVHAEGDRPEPAKADIFPAYDDDGGLLVVLTPK